MAATLYTGNGSTQTVSNAVNSVSFQPDLVWLKQRNTARDHQLQDSVRGATLSLQSNTTAAEGNYNILTSINSNGFTVFTNGTYLASNESGGTYVGWQWKAGGTAVSNTAGSITSSVSANTTAGFSVVTYTGTLGAAGTATVGHGLGVAPAMIITKSRNGTSDWVVHHTSLSTPSYAAFLNTTAASSDTSAYGTVAASTASVFTTNYVTGYNTNGATLVAYCWAPVAGYSAFGSYTGNGSADGPFIYTGFRPRWIMIKSSSAAESWYIWDTARDTYNVESAQLYPNLSNAEASAVSIDANSNGFKCRSATVVNTSSATYIYAAFAENPLKYANAR